jgi:hypothetical protein
MKKLFKQAFDDCSFPEAGDNFELWWDSTGKNLSSAQRNELLLRILKGKTGK